ncbi:hypothetical protein A2608_02975 [Candidatus Azambacteria bacterium RIFOXYD1_FULL_44_10]|nr:MAG: hypothetical protein A2608_02975 [Candidatus Azambacteria bacterium RIFOXYD1_FULL_44_10]
MEGGVVSVACVTVTVVDRSADPPLPEQFKVYVVVCVGVTVCVPKTAFVPDQPTEAVQDETLVDDQVSVED